MRWGMPGQTGIGRIGITTPLLAVALFAGGCSSSGVDRATGGSGGSSFGERFSQALSSGNAAPTPAIPASGSTNLDRCPNVDFRQGAGTYSINTASRDPATMQLRYQISITQTARECASVGGNLVIKVGMQGRIVLAAAGTPGVVEIPIRYALVEEGPQPKTLYTKLYKFPVTIPEGQVNQPFTHIEESMTVPMPPNAAFDHYVIYVGFDPLGAAAPQKKSPAPRKRDRSS